MARWNISELPTKNIIVFYYIPPISPLNFKYFHLILSYILSNYSSLHPPFSPILPFPILHRAKILKGNKMGLLEVTLILIAIVIILVLVAGFIIWLVRLKGADTRAREKCQSQVEANPSICTNLALKYSAYPGLLAPPSQINPCFDEDHPGQYYGTWGAPVDIWYQPQLANDACLWESCNTDTNLINNTKANLGPENLCKILSVTANNNCFPNTPDYKQYCTGVLQEGDPCYPQSDIVTCVTQTYCDATSLTCVKPDCVGLAIKYDIYPNQWNPPDPQNQFSAVDAASWGHCISNPTTVQSTINALSDSQACKILAAEAHFGDVFIDPVKYKSKCAGLGGIGDFCIIPNSVQTDDIEYCKTGSICDSTNRVCTTFDCDGQAITTNSYPNFFNNGNLGASNEEGISILAASVTAYPLITPQLQVCAATIASSQQNFTTLTEDNLCDILRYQYNATKAAYGDPYYQTHCKTQGAKGVTCIPRDNQCVAGLTCTADTTNPIIHTCE